MLLWSLVDVLEPWPWCWLLLLRGDIRACGRPMGATATGTRGVTIKEAKSQGSHWLSFSLYLPECMLCLSWVYTHTNTRTHTSKKRGQMYFFMIRTNISVKHVTMCTKCLFNIWVVVFMPQALVTNPLSDDLAKLKTAANGVVAAVVRLLSFGCYTSVSHWLDWSL